MHARTREQVAFGILPQAGDEQRRQSILALVMADPSAVEVGDASALRADPQQTIGGAVDGAHDARSEPILFRDILERITGELAHATEPGARPDASAAVAMEASHQIMPEPVGLLDAGEFRHAVLPCQMHEPSGGSQPQVVPACPQDAQDDRVRKRQRLQPGHTFSDWHRT